jgi:acid phosphatase family membrane protein YuiD
VRREVGNHAKVLNKFWILREKVSQDWELDVASEFISVTEEVISSSHSNARPSPRRSFESPRLSRHRSSEPDVTDLTEVNSSYIEEGYLLSESVGHTVLQVTVGALLGFVVSLAVYATL